MTPLATWDQEPQLRYRAGRTALWIYWIAGLTFLNMFVVIAGIDWENYLGLIGPLTIAYMGHDQAMPIKLGAAVICAVCCAVYALLGVFTARGARWAVVLAIVFYGIDSLIWIGVVFGGSEYRMLPSLAIHGYALWRLALGVQAAFALAKLRPAQPAGYQGVRGPADQPPGMWPSNPVPPSPVPPSFAAPPVLPPSPLSGQPMPPATEQQLPETASQGPLPAPQEE